MNQQEVYESLLKLNRMHVLHYIPRRRTPYIVYTQERMEPRYVQITREAYEERRERMADRIKSMITYATSSCCRQQMLLEYFGEKADYEWNRSVSSIASGMRKYIRTELTFFI